VCNRRQHISWRARLSLVARLTNLRVLVLRSRSLGGTTSGVHPGLPHVPVFQTVISRPLSPEQPSELSRTGDALDLVAVADAVRSVPNRVKLAQPWNDNTQSQLLNDAFQQAIELCQGRHVFGWARACNRAAALHGSRFAPMCSALFATADTTVRQRPSSTATFDPDISLDSPGADWEAEELSLDC
jgi:hypothetical protein